MSDIGIVTISYNQARFLREALDSVRVSDGYLVDHVVVDAGSNDGSRDIIRQYPDRRAIFDPDNGPSDGLNKGFKLCKGDVLGYLNSDDRFVPGALDWVIEYFKNNPEVDMILGAARIIDEKGRPRLRKAISWKFDLARVSLGVGTMVQPSTFFRRSLWEKTQGFNVHNETCWDGELAVDMLIAGARQRVVYKILSDFRFYGGSISSDLKRGVGERAKKVIDDRARIVQKIRSAGYAEESSLIRAMQKWANFFNPLRRSIELLVR